MNKIVSKSKWSFRLALGKVNELVSCDVTATN